MTLLILVDASESIAGTNWEASKQWIGNVFANANAEIAEMQQVWRADGWDITLCMRTSLIPFSSEVDVVWELDHFGEGYDEVAGTDQILSLTRPHSPLDTIHGTHTKDALLAAYEMVKAQRRPDERSMVLLLTDGLPQAVQGDSSQNPCEPFDFQSETPRGFAQPSNQNPDGQGIALKVISVGDDMLNNRDPFLCFETKDFIPVDDIIDPTEYQTQVNNEFFAEFCRVLTYGCSIPIYPHKDASTRPLYNTSLDDLAMNGSYSGLLYTFRVRDEYQTKDRSVDIWPHEASIQAESTCRDGNITLSATLWRWSSAT